MGIDFQIKKIAKNDVNFVFQIWDTAGQERFKSLITSYIRGSDIICVVYDITCFLFYDDIGKLSLFLFCIFYFSQFFCLQFIGLIYLSFGHNNLKNQIVIFLYHFCDCLYVFN